VLLPLAWQARRQVSHWQDSERLWRRAIEVTRDNYIAHASLGQHLIDVKRNAEAMAELQQAIRIRPQYPQPYGNIGLIHSASGRVKEAESAYLHALRLAPVNPVMHMNLGVLYAGTARPREAEAAYHEALRLAPESADVHYNLGLLYARAGRQQDALRAYRRATELAPHMVEVRGQLAILLTQLGRHAEAVEQNAQWLRLQPGSAIAHNNMANALVRLDRAREAIAHYQRASALDAKYVDPLINLGTAQLGLGDRAAARQAWEAALRMEPDNAIARQRLDKLAAETATGAARHR
jgi:tetratricopeptide (TPR) repeat protein